MSKVAGALLPLLLIVLTAACGGNDDDGGLFDNVVKQQAPRNATAVAPDRPRQLPPGLPTLPNLPAGVPSVQIPEVRSGTGSTTGACGLLTRQDAVAALGQPVNEGKSLDIPKQNLGVMTVDISTCSYNATNGPGQVALETWKAPDASQIRLIATVVCQGKEKVSGLGDNVCWKDKDHREIEALKGTTFVTLTVRNAPNENVVRDLAKKILDKV